MHSIAIHNSGWEEEWTGEHLPGIQGKVAGLGLETNPGWISGNMAVGNVNIIYLIFFDDGIGAY